MCVTDEMLHPELRRTGKLIRRVLPCFQETTFRKCDRLLTLMKRRRDAVSRGISVQILTLPTADGTGRFRLLVYRSTEQTGAVPGLLWLHGGGYALGIPEQDEGFIRLFLEAAPCVVVAPDYRLSILAPYPAPLEDCYAALLWLKEHAGALGVRTDQLFVGGDSAGGGLAVALTLLARDRGEVSIAFQMPLYPMLDDRPTGSSRDNDAPVWNTRSNEAAWRLYLGDLYGTASVPVYAAPGRCLDFSGLPPAVTYFGSVEPFRDETLAYMDVLRSAGVPVQYREFEGCFHGFDILCPRSALAREARAFLTEQFRHAVAHNQKVQPPDLSEKWIG